jgi:SAM-dependent methyltransferase
MEPVLPPDLATAALSLRAQSVGREVAADLRRRGIPVLMLKGPELQQRLYGTPAAYVSGDIDILVRPRDSARARNVLSATGWTFSPDNGVLWRLSRAAAFDRSGNRVDLHWGLHAAHLPSATLNALERSLWDGARPGPAGFLEPDDESLVVFLAVHAAGHRFERAEWVENVNRAAGFVGDWSRVRQIARQAHVVETLERALTNPTPDLGAPIVDGYRGRAEWWTTWLLRGHFLPRRWRDPLREAVDLLRSGLLPFRSRTSMIAGNAIRTPRGVFMPWTICDELVEAAVVELPASARSLVLEVGSGSGAVSLGIARRRAMARVCGVDVSHLAVRAARGNAQRNHLSVPFGVSDLLSAVPKAAAGRVDLIVSNIPAEPSVARSEWEPPRSLAGLGVDGSHAVRTLLGEAKALLRPNGKLIVMLRPWQFDNLAARVESAGFSLESRRQSAVSDYAYFTMSRGRPR